MLYLEDYLEMIEHLPQELRDRFTEMREMDLSVQNNMDSLEKRVRILFQQCRRGELVVPESDTEFKSIRKDYYRVLEDADEKVQLAGQMYDLVDRYLRRLDSELYKFKCELEADHNGITEILEKRSLELDASTNNGTANQKENRYFGSISSTATPPARNDTRYRPKPEKRRDSSAAIIPSAPVEKRQALATTGITPSPVRPTTPNLTPHLQVLPTAPSPSVSYNLQHIGVGNAIAAAASQAIAATQQMQQGRRTASLKASYEAIHGVASGSSGTHDLLIGRELAGATHNALQAVERETNAFSNQRRHKKKMITNSSSSSSSMPSSLTPSSSSVSALLSSSSSSSALLQATQSSLSNLSALDLLESTPSTSAAAMPVLVTDSGMVVEQTAEGEWTYDPNEPRYCICNQVSYGDMVACDNEDCPFEWFHYPCVNITSSPKGKWYCPQCSSSMRRRGSRKN